MNMAVFINMCDPLQSILKQDMFADINTNIDYEQERKVRLKANIDY